MTQVLRNKNVATKFQILVEIAANQPNIQQKDIARKIGVTAQAVSDYISKLGKDGWLISDGRSRYRITKEGVKDKEKLAEILKKALTDAKPARINAKIVASALPESLVFYPFFYSMLNLSSKSMFIFIKKTCF